MLIAAGVYLPGLVKTPPIDRDEARFAQASRQMFESIALPDDRLDPEFHAGDLIVPMVQDRPRLNKPPLIYWLQTASAWIFSAGDPSHDAIWMYRIPSVIGALIAVLATWRLGLVLMDPRSAFIGSAMLAVCPVVAFDAHQARADQVLLALCTLLLWQLADITRRAHIGRPARAHSILLLWVCVGLGVLTKGPITPMLIGLALLGMGILGRDWKPLRAVHPWLGITIVAAIVLPWVVAVAGHVGFREYVQIVFDETIGRSSSASEGHWAPPGYHLALLIVLFWPGSMLTGVGFVRAWRLGVRWGGQGRRWRDRSAGRFPELFLISSVLPIWIVFELISTKLPHYVLPAYPALALITARALPPAGAGALAIARSRLAKLGYALWSIVGFVLAGSIGVCGVALSEVPSIPLILLSAAALGLVAVSAVLVFQSRFIIALRLSVVAAAVIAFGVHRFILPEATALSPKIVAAFNAHGPDRPLAAQGYKEDSLVFLTRGRITKLEDHAGHLWLREHPTGLLVRLTNPNPVPGETVLDTITGFQLGRGRFVSVDIVERTP